MREHSAVATMTQAVSGNICAEFAHNPADVIPGDALRDIAHVYSAVFRLPLNPPALRVASTRPNRGDERRPSNDPKNGVSTRALDTRIGAGAPYSGSPIRTNAAQ